MSVTLVLDVHGSPICCIGIHRCPINHCHPSVLINHNYLVNYYYLIIDARLSSYTRCTSIAVRNPVLLRSRS